MGKVLVEKIIKADGFDFGILKAKIKELNELDILETKINIVGKKKDVIIQSFLDAIESIPEGSEEEAKLSKDILNLYNDYLDVADDIVIEIKVSDDSKEEVGITKEDKKKKEKTEKPKVEKKKKELSCFGHRFGSQSAIIDDIFKKGSTIEKAVEETGYSKTRIIGHLKHIELKHNLCDIVKNDKTGVIKIS